MFRVAAYTDRGPRKKSNQDSGCAEVAQTPWGDTALLVICDGVGGLSSGELASASVIGWLTTWFEHDYPALLERLHGNITALHDEVQSAWDKGLQRMNEVLRNYGRETGAQLGTTCTAILFFDGSFIIGHVGDSRVYQFSEGRMEIITIDQTWVAQEVARGNIPPEKARTHPKRNVILQSVGTQSELEPVFSRGTYAVGDAYMVCCDGFRNELFDDELIDAFGSLQEADERQIEEECRKLVQLVLQRGEKDNITAVAMSVQPSGSYADDPLGNMPGEDWDDEQTEVLTLESPSLEDDDTPTSRLVDPNDASVEILSEDDLPQAGPGPEAGAGAAVDDSATAILKAGE